MWCWRRISRFFCVSLFKRLVLLPTGLEQWRNGSNEARAAVNWRHAQCSPTARPLSHAEAVQGRNRHGVHDFDLWLWVCTRLGTAERSRAWGAPLILFTLFPHAYVKRPFVYLWHASAYHFLNGKWLAFAWHSIQWWFVLSNTFFRREWNVSHQLFTN